jgi:FkbM family methyltransferase
MLDNQNDQPFRHYKTKHKVVAWISQNLFGGVTYKVRNGLIKGMRRRGGLAWMPESLVGSVRTPEERFWANQHLEGLVIYDVGAFHGLLTLFFARKGKFVVSYEPNSRNCMRLNENLRLNRLENVLVRHVGVGSKAGVATMVASSIMLGGASVDCDVVAALLNSNLPVLSEQIRVTTLDDDIREMSLPVPDLIKVDVEGEELAVLIGAQDTLISSHPRLFLEMHGETMRLKLKKVAAIVAYLNELGYSDIRHVESGARIDARNSSAAAEGHLHCQ